MTKIIIYNQEQLEVAIQDLRNSFEKNKRINLSYEKASKEKTNKQIGFLFAALINGITDYLQECGFNVDAEDVRYKLYSDVAEVLPEMVIDKQIFGGKPRIKHLGDMDRELMSKFIDTIFYLLDTSPLYAGIQLHPSVYYNYLWHLDPEEIKIAQTTNLPERDEYYLEYVHNCPCMVCGIQHRSHAHHAKIPKYVSNSKKTPDWTAIPLCYLHHLQIAHNEGHKCLEEKLKWLPYDLETVCRISYLRWKFKNGTK